MKKHMVRVILLLAVILAFVMAASYLMPRKSPKGVIQTTGIVEATEVNLSPKITERLKSVNFIEGDHVKKGEVAFTLDEQKMSAEYQQAQANLEAAKADVLSYAADIEKAKVTIEDTKRDLDRYSALLDKKLVSQNDKDKAQTNYDLAVASLNKAQAQKVQAEASVNQAEAALVIAKTNLEDTVVISPISGVVTLKAFEPGEMVPAGSTVLTVVDLGDIWVRVDVEETAVSKIKIWDTAKIKVDSLPNKGFSGRVSEINSEGEFATQRDVRRGRQDIKTFRVKVKIDEPEGVLKQGMTATVTFGE